MEALYIGPFPEINPLQIASRNYNEFELIIALRNKNEQAFSYLYDNYAANLNNIILRRVNNRELSEDILQEVFIKIWNNFNNYDQSKGKLFTWMVSITKNMVIDFLHNALYFLNLQKLIII